MGKERVGLVLDTWHLWTAGVPWSQVATIDPSLIVCAHIGDSVWHRQVNWSDDDRNVLPGDGVVPLPQAVAAITETGFPGPWSVELLGSPSGWEPAALAAEMLRRARSILGRFE